MSFLTKILEQSKLYIQHEEAQRYLKQRGFDAQQITDLGLGYFPEDVWPLRFKGELGDVGAWNHWSKNGWRVKGKLVFPITNARGLLRGIQIRSPDPEQKDYSKFYLEAAGIDAVFFGTPLAMPVIWKTRSVYLCEGLFDLPPLLRIWPNTLCTGTANVSRLQMEFLRRYVDEVNVVFDADWGGDLFWNRFEREYARYFSKTRRVELGAKDPSDLWAKLGDEKLAEMLKGRNLT